MNKNLIQKIYFILLITATFSSSCVLLCDLLAKDTFSGADASIEWSEDSSMEDSNESSVEFVDDSLPNILHNFIFNNFAKITASFSYLCNAYEIHLGLNTPPPKFG